MKLYFKQRLFSWFDSYDIYDEHRDRAFTVKGQLSWGHRLNVMNANGEHIGTVREKIIALLPKFEMYISDKYIGNISKELTLFKPRYDIDCMGWEVKGNIFEWDYDIVGRNGERVASISKQLFNFTDTYVIDIENPDDALVALMVVLAIDAEKCSRDSGN